MPKISELTAATSVGSADLIPIVQAGTTKKASASMVVGGSLYPRTDDEVDAGVTPTDYQYPPGDVRRYGASTGSADNSAAIQTAIDQHAAGGDVPTAPPGTFACGSTIYVTGSCDFSAAVFSFGTNYTSNAIVVSPEKSVTPTTQLGYADIKLPEVRQTKSATGWAGVAGSVGVYCVNVWQCRILVRGAWYFETGVYFYGYNKDVTYNTVNLGTLYSNKVQLKLSWNTVGSGSCNQNTFIGGRFHIDSSEGDRVSGTKQVYLLGTAASAPNANTFIGCSIEGRSDEYAVHISGGGTYNLFLNCRYEATIAGKTILCDGANCRWNLFIGGFQLADDSAAGVTFTQANSAFGNVYFSGLGVAMEAGNTTGPGFAARHPNSNGYPSIAAYAIGDAMTDRTAYTVALRGTGIGVKNGDGNAADLWALTNNGAMQWGDGTNAADVSLSRTAANLVSMADGDSFRVQGTWDGGALRLGNYRLWVDATGDLRIKSSAPANDTDGDVIGTQS